MIHCLWNYRSQPKKTIRASQKFWLFLAWIQFFILFGLYAHEILIAGLAILLVYVVYAYTLYLRFIRNSIDHVHVEGLAQIELQTELPFKLSIEQAYLQGAQATLFFAEHPSLLFDYSNGLDLKKKPEKLQWTGYAKKLGVFEAPTFLIRLEDVSGMFYQQFEMVCDATFEVLPNSQSDQINETMQLLQADPNAMVWKSKHVFARKTDLVYGVRDYFPGDPVKLIDAKKTARYLRPMVKTFEQDETQHLEIILDTGRSMIGTIDSSEKVDFYALLAYQLVQYTTHLKDSYSFHTLHKIIESLIHKSYQAEDFLALYRQKAISVQPEDANLDRAIVHIQNLTKPSIVFLLLDMLKPSMQKAIVKRLPQLNKKHKLIVLHVVEDQYSLKYLVNAQSEPRHALEHKDYAQMLYAMSLEERKQQLMAQLSTSNVSVVSLPVRHAVSVVRELYRQLRF